MPQWDLSAVERGFGEAAVNPAAWKKALETTVSTTHSHGAVLLPVKGGVLRTLPFTDSMSGAFDSFVRDGWHLRDERNRGVPLMQRSGVVDDLDIFSPETIASHPYYQEFLAPHGLRWFAGVGIFFDDDIWCLSIQRTIDQGPFSAAEKNELAKLSRSLGTGAATARILGEATTAGALEAFAASSTAAVLVDRYGKIFEANASAEQLLSGEIRLKNGKLVHDPEVSFPGLDRALARILNQPEAGLHFPVPLPRKERGPLLAYPSRLQRAVSNAFADCQAIIILVDPDARKNPTETTLRSVYKLSGAEARLAILLSTGESLDTVAERLNISKETSRTQLKSIFAKLGVHRQAELVAVLSTLLNGII
ncbi:helix-turn-helix transcriptional regulator [Bradyrhizobium sp. 1]|uniref:helix-turn-helix transcriptional regulator n=1 Tax=Bradyrhizobium sp. 1 TaxID=241591 RepID=UPI001FFB9912|nr:helix-turn-helix transcriptional regulator [Bradyrhizobium sp. 1]MCK1391004.1 helix-turn-helix transcriptional regulator [Bradyrhizobium sp. 1]